MKRRLVYSFGPFRLDATARVLLKNGEPIRLGCKAVETLLVLVENAGQVLTKNELLSTVWRDRVVDEANLAQNVAVIRKALGVERGAPGYIETFPGRGYRILGPVVSEELTEAAPPAAEPGHGAKSEQRRARALALFVVVAVLAGSVVLWRRVASSPRAGQLRRVPVSRLTGMEYQPAVSPDGAAVAFVWEPQHGRAGGIWVQRAGETSPRRVAGGAGSYSSPAFSPDGRHLAYLHFQESSGAIVLASLDSPDRRVVATVFPWRYGLKYRHLDWSPDGRFLAVDDTQSSHEPLGIFLVSLATGEKKRLTQPDSMIVGDLDPRFSPDGQSICFIRVFHRAWQELFSVPVAGGAPAQITFDAKQVSGFDWTADGKSVVFGSDRSGEFRLWRLRYPRGTGAPPQQTEIYGDFPIQLSLARRSPVLVYSVLQYDLNIWRLDLAAGANGDDRWLQIIASSGQDASPQYSPARDKICFRSDRSGEEQLWICDSDGSNPVQVTRGALRPSVGRWSPDGRSIVFNNARTGEIYVARSSPEGRWTVTSTGAIGYHPVFSPDAQWIYAGTMNSIVRIPAAGGAAVEVARTKGLSLGASEDGRYLYFVREPADSALWKLETASGRIEKVLEGLVPYCTSCWAPTSHGIYYLGGKQGSPERQTLYFHHFATGRDDRVVDYPEPLTPIGSGPFSLSRDGRYLLCVRADPSSSDIFRVEPFR